MTQYQQVLEALKNLGGKGTNKDICANIDFNAMGWKATKPENSVSRYLTTSDDLIKEGDFWILKQKDTHQDSQDSDNTSTKADTDKNFEYGIYFITLNPDFRKDTAGFLFKIGKAENVSKRLKQYSAGLPFDPIRFISFYRIPTSIDLLEIERQIRGEILGGDTLDFKVQRFIGNHQIEWLQTLDLDFSEATIKKVAKDIDKIINDTIQYVING
jgi:hypothetical protein